MTPHLSKLIKYWLFYGASKVKSTHFHCCSKSYWGYWPDWLASQWAQYLWWGNLNHLSPHANFSFVILYLLFLNLIYQCVEMTRWSFLYKKMCNLKLLASSKRCHMKKSSCSFNMVKLTVNQRCCLIGMLAARIRIHDNIDPNWAIEVCKWNVTITICSFPYIGKSKELDYVRKSAHGVKSGSNHPP